MEQRDNFIMLLMVAALILLTALFFMTQRNDGGSNFLSLDDLSVVSDEAGDTTNPQVEITESIRRSIEVNTVGSTTEGNAIADVFNEIRVTPRSVGDEGEATTLPGFTPEDVVMTSGHVLGQTDADIVLTTYADLDGPYNKTFHETLKTIKQEYGDDKVAIVYKHFPLQALYPDSPTLAVASECVAEQNELAFWVFINLIFTERDVNARTDIAQLPTYVKNMGLNVPLYEACMQSGTYEALVEAQTNEAMALGAKGTPYTTISIAGVEEVGVINGAQPIEQVRKTLDDLILRTGGVQ